MIVTARYIPKLYRVPHDIERPRGLWRPRLPEVFRLEPDHHIRLREALQWLWRKINPHLDPLIWRKLLGNALAFTNLGHGFPGNADYVNGLELDRGDPVMDQARVCGGGLVAGTPGYRVRQTLWNALTLVGKIARRRVAMTDVRSELVSLVTNNVLMLDAVDVRKPIPSAQYVMARPWLYFYNTTVQPDGSIGRFPQGGLGVDTFTPLFMATDAWIPLNELIAITDYRNLPSPYWIPSL